MEQDKKEMESAVRAPETQATQAINGVSGDGASLSSFSESPIKIKWPLKLFLFCLSSFTLSLFFEGMRQCKESLTVGGGFILALGTLTTLALLLLQGFFMYCEERSKGNRTRKIALFDKWYLQLVSKQKGDSTNRG
jgi:hypothetical protein